MNQHSFKVGLLRF